MAVDTLQVNDVRELVKCDKVTRILSITIEPETSIGGVLLSNLKQEGPIFASRTVILTLETHPARTSQLQLSWLKLIALG